MKRVAKPEGLYNIVIEEVEVPVIAATDVLIRTERTLISRGSEIWRRYARPEAIEHQRMGYSLTGRVVDVGAQVTAFSPGDRVAALAPHAAYVAVDVVTPRHRPSAVRLPDAVSMETGTFWPLATSCVLWMWETGATSASTVVILGQGLVGSGCLQVARAEYRCRLIAVDAISLRCELAGRLGAEAVVHAVDEDPVEAVRGLTGGAGADVVVEAVGGRAGSLAFAQAQDMVKHGGLLQVLGLYEEEPLPLNSSKIQGRRLIGGYLDAEKRPAGSDRALQLLADGRIQVEQMITHRFPYEEAAAAFELLYNRLHEAMGVVLIWD